MKRIVCMAVAGAIMLAGSMVHAGSACCASKKDARTDAKADKAEKAVGCGDVLSKLNLTDNQKKKVEALKADCDKESCTEATQAKFIKGLKEILTADQLSQCKAECEKANKTACPLMKTDPKS